MDLWIDTAANINTRNAYKAGYTAGTRVAARVDVMRWDALFHYAEFRDSPVGRSMARDLKTAKQGFLDGFAAAQNRKALISRGASAYKSDMRARSTM